MSTFGGDGPPHTSPGEATGTPLTEEEQYQVARFLGDPTYFPIEFRRWLKDYIENAGIKISQSQIIGGTGGAAGNPTSLPPGIILPYAGTTFGTDCLPCNGASISRTDYSELFEAIGVLWGSDSASTFKVPDLRDRALYGVGSVLSIGQTDGKGVGSRGGPFHHHSFSANTNNRGGHKHSVTAMVPDYGGYQGGYEPAFPIGKSVTMDTSTAPDHNHAVSGDTTGGYDLDKPSFATVQYVIATGREVPT